MRNLKSIILIVVLLLSINIVFLSCKDDNVTYAEELKVERDLIADFIKRQNIKVVDKIPTDFPWEDKVYFETQSGVYFRLTDRGDFATTDSIKGGDDIVVRFDQYTLTIHADTLSSQSTINFPRPTEFKYLDYSQGCIAWHEAASYMKYNNARCQLIVPSKLGFSQFSRPATPIGYDMIMRVKSW